MTISLWMAFIAGFVSFFSPCILPLIPAYIMYMAGGEEELKRNRALIKTIGFVFGFSIIFILLGASASTIGKLLLTNRSLMLKVSGFLIVVFGLSMLGALDLSFLENNKAKKAPKSQGIFSSIIMGMAFAAGWTPCFGPILGSILVLASSTNTIKEGIFLLSVYSFGMSIPFIITALFLDVAQKLIYKYESNALIVSKVSGVVLILFGTLIFLDKVQTIAYLIQ